MKPQTAALIALLEMAITAGCAYYNGLYNANQLIRQATRAEREGRSGDARSLWEQVAVKAESVAVRYPNSKYHDDALLLWGQALAASSQCARAIGPLARAVETSSDTVVRATARLELGRCEVRVGKTAEAIATLTPLVSESGEVGPAGPQRYGGSVQRPHERGTAPLTVEQVARYWRATAHARNGDLERARLDFEQCGVPESAFELAVVHVRLERSDEALRQLATRIAARYVEQLWRPTLDSVGALNQPLAARAVDVLLANADLQKGERARLLADDAKRWLAMGDLERGVERYDELVQIAPGTAEAHEAMVDRSVARLRAAETTDVLPAFADSLEVALQQAATPSRTATMAVEVLQYALPNLADRARARPLLQAPAPEQENGGAADRGRHPDLELFLAAELARDSLQAPRLAATLFRAVRVRFPGSAIAPKALIAEAQLDVTARVSLMQMLGEQYAGSPYTLALEGVDTPRFAVIEDSLRMLLTQLRGVRPGSADTGRRNPS